MHRILLLLPLLLQAACQTTSPQPPPPVSPMQMPAKAEGVARIVVFRSDSRRYGFNLSSQPTLSLSLNGQDIGAIENGAYIIRDLPPGEQTVTLTAAAGSGTGQQAKSISHRADINADGEWYIRSRITSYDCKQTPFVSSDGTPLGTTVMLISVATALASMHCATHVAFEPMWPHGARRQLDPLLANAGARPLAESLPPDRPLPRSGWSWRAVDAALRAHFEREAAAILDAGGRGNAMLESWALLEEHPGDADGAYDLSVELRFMRLTDDTLAGLSARRQARYSMAQSGGRLTVTAWKAGD